MKYSTKLSDAIHILTYIVINQGTDLSSTQIAKSVNSNPVVIRRIMSQLKNDGCLLSSNGRADPKLARPADTISLLDIYRRIVPSTYKSMYLYTAGFPFRNGLDSLIFKNA
ncbi:MAG: Rrf2 family transcriptional regulator, partial [Leuconostoc mesenteroides]